MKCSIIFILFTIYMKFLWGKFFAFLFSNIFSFCKRLFRCVYSYTVLLVNGHLLEHWYTYLNGHEQHAMDETTADTVDKRIQTGHVVPGNVDNRFAFRQTQPRKSIDDARWAFQCGENPYNALKDSLHIRRLPHWSNSARYRTRY